MPPPDIPQITFETLGAIPFGANSTSFKITGYGFTDLGKWISTFDTSVAKCWSRQQPMLPA